MLEPVEPVPPVPVPDVPVPVPDAAHVDRWVSQFTPANQLEFLREFRHVIAQTFVSEEYLKGFLKGLITNSSLVGGNPAAYWNAAHVLDIQQNGESQRVMRRMFGTEGAGIAME